MSRTKEKKNGIEPFADALIEKFLPNEEGVDVSIALILPVYNCAEVIGTTLDSIKRQHYTNLEVVVVDAGSTDRTLEIVSSYHTLISRIYTITEWNLYDMINRGIALISAEYVSVIMPGSVYLSDHVFYMVAKFVLENAAPDLIYFGSIQRDRKKNSKILNAPLRLDLLVKGIYPTNFTGCVFKTDLFEKIGKFDTRLKARGGFDIFCRFAKEKALRSVRIDRVLVDADYTPLTIANPVRIFADIFSILHTHFGLRSAFKWFLGINHLIVIKMLWKNLKVNLFKKRS